MSTTTQRKSETQPAEPAIDKVVAITSVGILVVFVAAALIVPSRVSDWVATGFTFSANTFGFIWQVLLLVTFLVALVCIFLPWSSARLGARDTPEYGRFKWIAMIMCTLLAGGGVFWAAAEPMYHFLTTPPLLADSSADAASIAMAQSFVHWGFLAWAILGSLGTIVMLYGMERGMPLRPRTLLYPVLGERVKDSWIGKVADIACIIAVVAGTVGPIGFLGLQVSYGLSTLFGVPDNYGVQLAIIGTLTTIAVISVVSGIDKGIQILSQLNVWLALALALITVVLGSVVFAAQTWLGGIGVYVTNFFQMSLYQGDEAWVNGWTVFFFGWFLGYGPLMSIFIARISRGRTARDLLISTAVIPPIATTMWFTMLGGTGIRLEQESQGSISEPLGEAGLPAAMMAISQNLPLAGLLGALFLVLTITFVATTTDSMSYAISQACTSNETPTTMLRAVWAIVMGVAAATLISIGDGGISALQSFIVITAVPVGFIMMPSVVAAPLYLRTLAKEQGR
ncbi:MAG TPA: BCCT family transporter [Ornithinimicrobium sp.]|uniref:BCCT family transporter n=1 Tax=Ornithinimicrobium sp. TaxID=1977084 RepID=UPI002B47A0CC|nr:BCCT family transporter [Ornithinimicrobium sp.]HKJ11076.1 BCCT family transporter [Ornithinimicrobium sp.]